MLSKESKVRARTHIVNARFRVSRVSKVGVGFRSSKMRARAHIGDARFINQEGSSGEMRKNTKYGNKWSRCFAICLLNQLTRCGQHPGFSNSIAASRTCRNLIFS